MKTLKSKEIENGRLAMIAMLGYFIQASFTHVGPYANLQASAAERRLRRRYARLLAVAAAAQPPPRPQRAQSSSGCAGALLARSPPLLLRSLMLRLQAGAASAPADAYVAVNRYRLTSPEHVPAFEAEVNARAEASKKEVRARPPLVVCCGCSLPLSRVS